MEFGWAVGACLLGYLAGAVSFTRIVVRRVSPTTDLTTVTIPVAGVDEPMRMTSVSANTAGLALGPKIGGLIGILDVLKVFVPTLVLRLLVPDPPYFLLTAVFGVVGHNWPVYYRFRGGRGISPIFGGLLAVDWVGALVASAGGMFLGLAVFRDFALVFPLMLLLIIPWMWLTTSDPLYVAYAVTVNVLFAIAIIPELKEVVRSRRTKGGAGSRTEMLESNPMGQSMLAIYRRVTGHRGQD